ncbi:MAG: FAD-binding oxidoreductase [Proteobacteria bacterium]|nr:FAD-binding oxidoreductase [Pseudomonadota bacterium]
MLPAYLEQLSHILGPNDLVVSPAQSNPLLIDERQLYRGRAAAIVQPRTTEQLSQVVSVCAKANVAMVPQGGNTGYCGGATPDESGLQVLINLSKMNQILDIDAASLTLTAQAGVVLADAQNAAANQDMLLPLSMGSQASCQLGGNISTNAGGLAVLRYGTAREMVAGLEVVLPDGQIWSDLKGLRKDNTGYDLKQFFMGAEGTLGIISAAVVRLQPRPRAQITAFLETPDLASAVSTLMLLREHLGDCITSFEYMSREALMLTLVQLNDLRNPLPAATGNFVLMELAAFDDGAGLTEQLTRALQVAILKFDVGDCVVAQNDTQRGDFWRLRESIPEAEKRAGGSIKHDVSVEISKLSEFAVELQKNTLAYVPGCRISLYGHLGDGNIHFNVLAPPTLSAAQFKREFADPISALVHSAAINRDGSFSAEHGVGRLKRDLLASSKDPVGLQLMRKIKRTLDPNGLMNPGKVL